jgi:hypothetical protein
VDGAIQQVPRKPFVAVYGCDVLTEVEPMQKTKSVFRFLMRVNTVNHRDSASAMPTQKSFSNFDCCHIDDVVECCCCCRRRSNRRLGATQPMNFTSVLTANPPHSCVAVCLHWPRSLDMHVAIVGRLATWNVH